MGCNCSKPSRRPAGSTPPSGSSSTSSTSATARPSGGAQPSVGPAKGQTQTFTLQTGDGRTQSFGSRLERDAAAVRSRSRR